MLDWVCQTTGARAVRRVDSLQALWSGYGEIVRVELEGADVPSVIVKRVSPPERMQHPRGWNGEYSTARKLRSYEVEKWFYLSHAQRCVGHARVPSCYAAERTNAGWRFLLEDLNAAGFAARRRRLRDDDVLACLQWLAAFHASFLGAEPTGLWPEGTYWHLETRPDELAAMPAGRLREAATEIDRRLSNCKHRTLVHGDAKSANFCFGAYAVAALDFQYVGGGCGVKDVAYLLSCLDTSSCEQHAERYLDHYFAELRRALMGHAVDGAELESEWRSLYVFAWADFARFLAGWSPGHAKQDRYAAAMVDRALMRL